MDSISGPIVDTLPPPPPPPVPVEVRIGIAKRETLEFSRLARFCHHLQCHVSSPRLLTLLFPLQWELLRRRPIKTDREACQYLVGRRSDATPVLVAVSVITRRKRDRLRARTVIWGGGCVDGGEQALVQSKRFEGNDEKAG